MKCQWCASMDVKEIFSSVFWELPDGTRAIEIADTPTITCQDCLIVYQDEAVIKEIEDQLFLVDCKQISRVIPYSELMKLPRLLKKNYFDFTS